jgi:serine/threonine-protein kinase RsbW
MLSIESDLGAVAGAARAVRGACEALLPAEATDQVEIAVVEVLNNIIKHGHGGQAGHTINLDVDFDAASVSIDIYDVAAQALDIGLLENAALPDFDEKNPMTIPEGGMGLALVRLCMDEIEYSSQGGTHHLRMIKKRSGI